MMTSDNGFSVKSSDISINRNGSKTIKRQELQDWEDCKYTSKASFGNCFDICLNENKQLATMTLSLRPSEQCCKNSENRRRDNSNWMSQIDADISPTDELNKAVCKYAPTIVNYLGDKGADWLCSKGEGMLANAACGALLDSIDIGWIPDVDNLCAELLEDGLNALGLESECDNLAEEGADYITNLIDEELTSYLC